MQLVLNVEELLKELLLFTFADLVLLGPTRVQLFIESIDFVFLLGDHVIDLHFYAVTALLQELGRFLF